MSVDSIRLDKPVIYLRREGDTWSLSRLVKKQETRSRSPGAAPSRSSIDAIGITDGSVVVDEPVGTSGVEIPKRFDHLDAKLSFKYEPVRYSIEITQVSFRGSEPAHRAQRAVGRRLGEGRHRVHREAGAADGGDRRCRSTARCSII